MSREDHPNVAPRRLSAVEQAANELRARALALSEGVMLGSEDELMGALGVSRPTLRQAAGQVAQDHLITIRRGVSGGYFAARPGSIAVARIAAIYLRSRSATLAEAIEAVMPIRTELARLASQRRDPQARRKLESFLENERINEDGPHSYRDFLRAERAFGRVLGEICGNEVLALFLNIVYDLSGLLGRGEDVYVNHPERVETFRRYRNDMAAAILDGDAELAVIATKRCAQIVAEWMKEDLLSRPLDTHITEVVRD